MLNPYPPAPLSRHPRGVSAILAALALLCVFAVAPVRAQATVTKTADYDAAGQYAFTVPAGVTSISVTAIGAAGGANCAAPGGKGAKLAATVPVTPGELLEVTVGEAGVDRPCFTGEGASVATLGGGARGGASGSWLAGSAGGGATSLRHPSFVPEPEWQSSLVVAGGGGGAAESSGAGGSGGDAGEAGGAASGSYAGHGGQPGELGAGGAGGAGEPDCIGGGLGESGATGALGVGGHGGDFTSVGAGGGGGGGFYGGGGGGGGCRGGGGGGGSSFAAAAATVTEAAAPSAEGARLSIAYLAPSPTATIVSAPAAFPSVPQGGVSAPQTVELTNTGEAPLIVGGTSFAGSDPEDFLIGSSTCGSQIEPGRGCQMRVRFTPQAQGPRTATLLIAGNDPAGPTSVDLSGTGAPPVGATGGETGVPGAWVKAPATQLQDPRKPIRIKVWTGAGESARAIVWGKIQIGKRSFALNRSSGALTAHKRKLFALRPVGSKGLKAIRRQLSRGATVRARVTARIVDSAGNRYQRTVRVALKYRKVGVKK